MKKQALSKGTIIKNTMVPALSVALLSTTIGTTAVAANYSERQVYRNGNFGQLSNQLRQDLRRSGYHVMNIKADGSKALTVYAKKNNQPYELKYSYPDLNLISSNQKDWANLHQNNNHHQHNNGYDANGRYNNNNYYGNRYQNNVEDNIKSEARYPAIRQRALRKLNGLGYKVTSIDLDEKNNRGVFEIEAKKGGQDYDIVLSYPSLDIIKIEKD